jgi:hypothetical protein
MHQCGKIEDIMEKVYSARKGQMMDMKENFCIYIYEYTKSGTNSCRNKDPK